MVVGVNPKAFDDGTFIAEITYGRGICELLDVENIHYDEWPKIEKVSETVKECARGLEVELYDHFTETYSHRTGSVVSSVFASNQNQLKLFYKKLKEHEINVYSVKEFYMQ